jgi:opacity protein-like surface antigen
MLLALAASAAGGAKAHAAGFGVEAQAGYFSMSATQSAQAVFDGSTGGATFGGAVRYVVKRGFFVAAGARTFSKSGQRVFLADKFGTVQKLGFPLDMRITPIFVTVGYRFRDGHALVPYAGLGGGITKFHETSDVAGDVRDENSSKGAFQAVVGVEYGKGLLRFGAEGVYSTANSLGLGGVSKIYGETDAGGLSAIGKVILSFGK